MGEVGKDLEIISSIPSAQAGSVEQVAQHYVQLGFEYLQGWSLHSLSGHLVPVSDHPHS